MTAPPQYSPDGQWYWDGSQWVPAPQAAQAPTYGTPPATQAPTYGTPPAYGTPPQYGVPYGAPPAYGYPPPSNETDGKAIASLVTSLLWLCGLGSIAAVVFGHLSRSEAKKLGRQPSGLAMAGLVLGYLGIAGTLLAGIGIAVGGGQIGHSVSTSIELLEASQAEHAYHDAKGVYTPSLEDLGPYGYDRRHPRVVVLRADATGFCLTARVLSEAVYISDRSNSTSSTPC